MAILGESKLDNLFAGGTSPVATHSVTLKQGQPYTRGMVLGLVGSENKATLVDSAAVNGSEKPYAVLAEDVDATNSDRLAAIYLTGEFNEDALVFGGTDTKESHRIELREIGIFLKKTRS